MRRGGYGPEGGARDATVAAEAMDGRPRRRRTLREWRDWHRRRHHGLAKHLYVRIYLALLCCLLMMALAFMGVMRWTAGGSTATPRLEVLAEAAAGLLPPAGSTRQAQEQSLEHWHSRAGVDLALFSADGSMIAAAGLPQWAPAQARMQNSHWAGGHPPTVALKLPDGRWLSVRYP